MQQPKATMNQFEGRGSEYFGTPIRVPDIEVVGPRLLVRPPNREEYTSEGGIIIPLEAQERVTKGLILIVGNGVVPEGGQWDHEGGFYIDRDGNKIESRYAPGMEVLYAQYAGVEIELYGQLYYIINEIDVRCILERYKLTMEEGD